jgi:hypothetical protein
LQFIGIAQQGTVGTYHQRKIVGLRREPCDQRDGYRILRGIKCDMRMAVSSQEIAQRHEARIVTCANEDGPIAAFDGRYAPQDQGTRESFSEFSLGHHQCPQTFRRKHERFDILDYTCVDESGLAGQLADVGTEFTALHARAHHALAPQAIAADDANRPRQEHEQGCRDSRFLRGTDSRLRNSDVAFLDSPESPLESTASLRGDAPLVKSESLVMVVRVAAGLGQPEMLILPLDFLPGVRSQDERPGAKLGRQAIDHDELDSRAA